MSTRFMRILDKIIGIPICVCLGILLSIKRKIYKKKKQPIQPESIKNILCIKFFGAGSLFLAMPLFKGLHKKFPQARIHLITFGANKEFLEVADCVDVVLPVSNESLFRFSLDICKYFIYFLRNRINLSIDLEFFSKFSIILSLLYLSKFRVGLFSKMAYRGDLLSHNINFNHYRHISEVFFELGKCVGVEYDKTLFELRLPSFREVFYSEVQPLLELESGQKYIIVNVNASDLCPQRKWPISKFFELVTHISLDYPQLKIIFIGSKSERPYVDSLHRQFDTRQKKTILNLAGTTTIRQLLSLLEHAELLITNDSGPAHFASGYNIPQIVFFGPETPLLYKPFGDKVTCCYTEEYCSPCLNIYDYKNFAQCDENICMTRMSVPSVLKTVNKMIAEYKIATYSNSLS